MTRLVELRFEHSRGLTHQSCVCAGAGEQAAKRMAPFAVRPAPFAIRRRTPAMAQRIAIAAARTGAPDFGNKIVRHFLPLLAYPSPRRTAWRAQKRRRDDGGFGVREGALVHSTQIGMNSEMGIVSARNILSP
jgi:hypothetical protein